MKGFRFVLLLAAAAWMTIVAGSAHAQVDASAPGQAAEPRSLSREASVLSDPGTTSEDRPVLSIDQTETNESDVEEPVLFSDSVGPAPAQSPLGQGEEVSSEQTGSAEVEGAQASKPREEKASEQKKWGLQFRSRLGIAYDDNIFISNTNRVGDTILTITGAVSLVVGDWRSRSDNFLVADYEASGIFYFENPDQDSFNQVASLIGQYRIQRLTMQLRSQYMYLTGAVRDVGDLAARSLINDSLRLVYDVSEKTALTAEGFADLALYQKFFNSYEYGAKAGAEYQILQKIRIGPQAVIGFLNVTDSPFQVYEQIRARATYNATGKISFEGSAGVEFRQFSSESQTYFVFSLAANYRPFDGTTITLQGYRNIYGSAAFEGQDFIATGVEFSFTQRFFQLFYLSVATGYENDDYIAVAENSQAGRVDNFVYIRPALAFAFTKWTSFSVFYEFRKNFSNESEFTFYDNRVGAALAFQL